MKTRVFYGIRAAGRFGFWRRKNLQVRAARPAGHGFRREHEGGFTLMEMLVALSLFSIVLASATEIYLLAGTTQRKAFTMERVQSDARYSMEVMTREIRGDAIDYDYYAGRAAPLGLPDTELALVAPDNSHIRFEKSGPGTEEACADAASRPCLLVVVDGSEPVAITPKGVGLTNLKFYVAPIDNPFYFDPTSGYVSNVQPHVTVVMSLASVGGKAAEQASINLQTTATSRAYRR